MFEIFALDVGLLSEFQVVMIEYWLVNRLRALLASQAEIVLTLEQTYRMQKMDDGCHYSAALMMAEDEVEFSQDSGWPGCTGRRETGNSHHFFDLEKNGTDQSETADFSRFIGTSIFAIRPCADEMGWTLL